MSSYSEAQQQSSPPCLQGPNGLAWAEAVGLMKDAFLAAAKSAVYARFIALCPSDGLDTLGDNYDIERGYNSTDDSYRALLTQAWQLWQQSATPGGFAYMLETIGYSGFDYWEAWQWFNSWPLRWWRFWVVFKTSPFPAPTDGAWDDAGTWDDGGNWADIMPYEALIQLSNTFRKWRGAGRQCENTIWLIRGGLWGDPGPLTPGATPSAGDTWGYAGDVWGGDLAAYYQP